MFKAVRISILLFILFFVAVSTWLTQARSTDWNNSLWIKIYPINADGSPESTKYIDELELRHFEGIENFLAREAERYGSAVQRPVRIELGSQVREQPPELPAEPKLLSIMAWSLKMRWWAATVTDSQPLNGHPVGPDGIAEPDRRPLYPQRFAEIMGGRIALAEDDSEIPSSLKYAMIGGLTASEINLTD
jgi:hypothetical protein